MPRTCVSRPFWWFARTASCRQFAFKEPLQQQHNMPAYLRAFVEHQGSSLADCRACSSSKPSKPARLGQALRTAGNSLRPRGPSSADGVQCLLCKVSAASRAEMRVCWPCKFIRQWRSSWRSHGPWRLQGHQQPAHRFAHLHSSDLLEIQVRCAGPDGQQAGSVALVLLVIKADCDLSQAHLHSEQTNSLHVNMSLRIHAIRAH